VLIMLKEIGLWVAGIKKNHRSLAACHLKLHLGG
jgi:hypothetical protein